MAQLTRQDIAEVVEEVLDRKLDEKLDSKLDQKLDSKLDERFSKFEDKMERKMGFFIEHIDDKFDSLAEVVSLMNDNINKKADKTDLEEIRDDIKTIKFAVKETNKDLIK
jgi:hypothetical protein